MTADEATAYLGGDEYRRDPFGPSFDPGAMLAVLRSGIPEARSSSPRLAGCRTCDEPLTGRPTRCSTRTRWPF
ncbi:MAG: hypothetical protein ACM4D3_05480 [Candidatus Sericytochromatia bacterium]